MIEKFSFAITQFYPAITVLAPIIILAPQAAISPTRSNGFPPTITVTLPATNGVVVGCGEAGVGTIAHTCISPTTAAGIPPIITLLTPGPIIDPPCAVLSPTLAACGILVLMFIYQSSLLLLKLPLCHSLVLPVILFNFFPIAIHY
jgi:hypothetical protein